MAEAVGQPELSLMVAVFPIERIRNGDYQRRRDKRNVGTNYGEFREFSREEMGMPKIIWKFKRSSICQEDTPSIYRK